MPPFQRSITVIVFFIVLAVGQEKAQARSFPGRIQNCTSERLRMYANGKFLMILAPHQIHKHHLPYGSSRILIRQMKKPHRVVLSGRLQIRGMGWLIQIGCKGAKIAGKKLLFKGYFRNCGKKTLQIYLDGKLLGSLESGKRLEGVLGGVRHVRIAVAGQGRALLERSFAFGRNWRIEWGCSSQTRGRFRCAEGYYVVRLKGQGAGCCPIGTVYKGAGICVQPRRQKHRPRERPFRCPYGYHRVGKTHICCPAGTSYAAGACVDNRLLKK